MTLALHVAVAALGCGGGVVSGSGGSGGSGGGGQGGGATGGGTTTNATTTTTATTTTATTTTTTVPPACAVSAAEQPPYAVTVRFTNPSAEPLYLLEECSIAFSISACADGYAEPLAISGACTVDCADPEADCIDCAPCPTNGLEVLPGGAAEAAWAGMTYTFGANSEGCSCHDGSAAPAAKYRVRAPVFLSQADVEAGLSAFETVRDFDLPAPGGVIEVPIGPVPK